MKKLLLVLVLLTQCFCMELSSKTKEVKVERTVTCTVKSQIFASSSEDGLKQLQYLIEHNDKQGLYKMCQNGSAFLLEAGTSVGLLSDGSPLHGRLHLLVYNGKNSGEKVWLWSVYTNC